MLQLTDQPFDPGEALSTFSQQAEGAGGIVSFSGHVRSTAKNGPVSNLYLEAYSPMTEQGIQDAMGQAHNRWPLIAQTIIHRVGDMTPGEAIVFVATASKHRRAAFEAADYLMDYLKTKAIFWKKETTTKGARWIEPRAEDYQDSARWTA